MRCRLVIAAVCIPALSSLLGCTTVLEIEPDDLPAGAVGTEYEVDLDAAAPAPLSWRLTSGSLPSGLELDRNSGRITGEPTEAGDFTFTVTATTTEGFVTGVGSREFSLTIQPQLFLGENLGSARVGLPYTGAIPITGGVQPYNLSVVGLPAGLTVDSTTGIISGSPLTAQNLQLVVTVSDAGPPVQNASQTIFLQVKPPPVRISTDALPEARIGQAYSAQLGAENGTQPLTWRIGPDVGTLPPGLRLNQSTGRISGTPTAAGTYAFTVSVTDADTPATSDARVFTIVVAP